MLRRSIPLALAGAALIPAAMIAPARAQSPGAAAPRANTPPASMAGMAPAQMVERVQEAGAFSLMTARIGVEQATTPELKRFANFEVTEQEGIAQALKLAGHTTTDVAPTGEKAELVRRLQAARGGDFDKLFLETQEAGHQELLNLTTALMDSQAPVPDRVIATLANGQIKEHLILIGVMMGRS